MPERQLGDKSMLIEKEEIDRLYDKHMGDEGMAATLKDMIEKPNRYVGIFRSTNIATKVIQSSSQSREIKFGYFIEELTTEYIKALGYDTSLKKYYSAEEIGEIGDNNGIEYDQLFSDGDTLYVVEQKVRDDHDSTKRGGQFENFVEKINFANVKFPQFKKIVAIMWFVDDSMKKNRKYYAGEISEKLEEWKGESICLVYGEDFFKMLKGGETAWKEMTDYLAERRKNDDGSSIINFDEDKNVYEALLNLPGKEWNKLLRNEQLLDELFKDRTSENGNLQKATKERERRGSK